MYKNSRTVWTEGMFLGPQHFQQHDRFLLNTIAASTFATESHPYGVLQLSIDENILTDGKFALSKVAGIFPGGTPFNLPEDGELPLPVTIGNDTQNSVVHLAIPYSTTSDKDATEVRSKEKLCQYIVNHQSVIDRQSEDSNSEETIFTGSLWTRLLVGTEANAAFHTIPLARIIERREDGTVILDKNFFCCAMSASASAPLRSYCKEIIGLMKQRASELAGRLGQVGSDDISQISLLMLLKTINRALPLLEHLISQPVVHPEHIYREYIQLIGEFSSLTNKDRLCPPLPGYLHRSQHESFAPVVQHLRDSLNWIPDSKVESISIVHIKAGVHTAKVPDLHLFDTARFILSVNARMTPDEITRNFPNQTTISSKTKLRDLVEAQARGVELMSIFVVPTGIPVFENNVYFELRQDDKLWPEISKTGEIAMHIAGGYSDLKMQLWAVAK